MRELGGKSRLDASRRGKLAITTVTTEMNTVSKLHNLVINMTVHRTAEAKAKEINLCALISSHKLRLQTLTRQAHVHWLSDVTLVIGAAIHFRKTFQLSRPTSLACL